MEASRMSSRDYLETKAGVLSAASEALGPTFDPAGGQNPIMTCQELPSEADVLKILGLLDDIFYPGYRGHSNGAASLEAMLVERLDACYDLLYRQVLHALPLRWKSEYARSGAAEAAEPLGDQALSRSTAEVVGSFFCALASLREQLKLDVVAAYNGDPAARSFAEVIFSYPGLRAITTHRVAHVLYGLEVPLIPRLMSETVHRATGIEIHPGAQIGPAFFVDHGTGVVIGETTQIGARVKLYQGVTLGAYSFKLDEQGHPLKGGKRHPTIEDDVVIYAGATILGGSTVVGAGSVIGSNVSITRSVPAGAVVTMRNASEYGGGLPRASGV